MRDRIKQILVDWVKGEPLPITCTFVSGTGWYTVTNVDDPWANWKVSGSSMPGYDKVTYCIFNKYHPDIIKEQGVLEIGVHK